MGTQRSRSSGLLARVLLLTIVLSMSGCDDGQGSVTEPSETAYWRLASEPDPAATEFDIDVLGGGCHRRDGPDDLHPIADIRVDETQSSVQILVTLGPLPGSRSICAMIGAITQETVRLEQPLGDRRLIDGACEPAKHRGGVCHFPTED